jgi:hypothetical protein
MTAAKFKPLIFYFRESFPETVLGLYDNVKCMRVRLEAQEKTFYCVELMELADRAVIT